VIAQALPAEAAALLKQAAEWRLISLLFGCPRTGWKEQLQALADEIDDRALRSAAELALIQGSEGLYHSIFGPGGPAPAREVSYRRLVQFGSLLSELAAYYQAFAYVPARGEALDHIAVETDFIAYLRVKQAYALHQGDTEHAGITADAAGTFVRDHIAVMTEPLAAALRLSDIPYLDRAAEALFRRVGPPPADATAPPAVDPLPDQCPFACGAEDPGDP